MSTCKSIRTPTLYTRPRWLLAGPGMNGPPTGTRATARRRAGSPNYAPVSPFSRVSEFLGRAQKPGGFREILF